jgi:hypothetical protein
MSNQNLNFQDTFTLAAGRVFFNGKDTGNSRVIASGILLPTAFVIVSSFPPDESGTEEELLGMALDPSFSTNHYSTFSEHLGTEMGAKKGLGCRLSLSRKECAEKA